MNTSDLHKAFKVSMDKNADAVAFGGCPAFLPEEIDLFLNLGYIDVILNMFTGNNTLKVGFEGSVKRIADLQKLVKTDNVVLLSKGSGSNVLTMTNFSNNNQRMLYVDAILHFDDSRATCILTDHNIARRFLLAHNNTPWIENPVITMENNNLNVYIDPINMVANSYTIELTYVKYPLLIDYKNNISIQEVPDYILYDVVDKAVVIALENIESKRAESKNQLNSMNE